MATTQLTILAIFPGSAGPIVSPGDIEARQVDVIADSAGIAGETLATAYAVTVGGLPACDPETGAILEADTAEGCIILAAERAGWALGPRVFAG